MTQVVIMICAMAIYLHDEGIGFGAGLNPGEATGATLGLLAACWALGQAVTADKKFEQ